MADVKLTHKLRNPKSYNKWMDIWTATVHDPESQGASPKYEIKPSDNWKISPDVLDNIPVDKIKSVNSTETIGETEKNYTTTNVTIKSEPVNNTLGLNGNSIAITNTNGSIREGAQINPSTGNEELYLSEKGTFIALPPYFLTGVKDNSNVKIILNKNTTEVSDIIVNGSGKITTTFNDNIIKLNLAENSVGTDELINNSVTPNKINWDYEDNSDPNNPITMASKIKDTIKRNSSANDGIVPATKGTENAGKIWSADAEGNPDWNDFSSTQWDKATDESLTAGKLDTKLLGATINENQPFHMSSSKYDKFASSYYLEEKTATFSDGTFTENLVVSIAQDQRSKIVSLNLVDNFAKPNASPSTTASSTNAITLLPNLKDVLDGCVNILSVYWNETISKSPGYAAKYSDTLRSEIGQYLQDCLNNPSNHPEITYKTIAEFFPNMFNDWDWKHLGIWIEI